MADEKKPKPVASDPCPCGSGKTFGECCLAVHEGRRPAATAEELMRARYSAHVAGNDRFLHATYLPTSGTPFHADSGEQPATEWTRLEIHAYEPGRGPDQAFVDFSAYGTEKGSELVLHEKAEFVRKDGNWIYTRAVRLGPAPMVAAAKPGRNDPCPCGSGRKYKHCCLGKS